MRVLSLVCFSLALGAATLLHAQVPELIRYQGRLVDGGGLVNGSQTIVFSLFNTDVGGTALFQETQTVQVVDGLYAVSIGASNSAPNSLSTVMTNTGVYLEVNVSGSILSPRERITAASYALVSRAVTTGAITTAMLADNAVTSNKIVNGTIGNPDLANNAVTGSKILDGSIGSGDLGSESVTLDKFADQEDFYVDNDGTIHATKFVTHVAPNSVGVNLIINNATQSVFLVGSINEENDVITGAKGAFSGDRIYNEITVQRRMDTNLVWRTWMANILADSPDERDIRLVLEPASKGGPLLTMDLIDAFPSQLVFVPIRMFSGSKGAGSDPTTVYHERMTIQYHNWDVP